MVYSEFIEALIFAATATRWNQSVGIATATASTCAIAPLIAATPTDDTATRLIGYNPAGASVSLDATRVPDRPVLLVEVDTAKALPLGVAVPTAWYTDDPDSWYTLSTASTGRLNGAAANGWMEVSPYFVTTL